LGGSVTQADRLSHPKGLFNTRRHDSFIYVLLVTTNIVMALNGLLCADVPLRNYSLTITE